MKSSNQKKSLILLIIGISALLLLITGATFAYFRNQIDDGKSSDLNVTTGTVDNLTFSLRDIDVTSDKVTDEHNPDGENANAEIVINARQDNFGKDGKSLGDGVELTASLLANDATNEATNNYNLFFVIEENNFVYSSEDEEPEIILSVTDPGGNEVSDIKGLKKVDGGFDITKRKGSFLIVSDKVIVAKPKEEQTWKVKVTLVNLPIEQNKNQKKSLTGKVYITTESMPTYELPEITNSSVDKTYNTIKFTPVVNPGSEKTTKYYYGIEKTTEEGISLMSAETVQYEESTEPSYTFKKLQANTKYTIYSYVEDESGIKSNVYTTEVTTNEYKIPVINNVTFTSTLYTIKAVVDAEGRDGDIILYHYYKDGELITSIPEAEYTYEGLSDTNEYDLKIEVEDENHVKSTAFEQRVSTKEYIYPEVASVDISNEQWNSVTLTTNTKESTNEVTKYEYQVETKEGKVVQPWFEGSKTQVISGLDAEQEYNVKIKLTDSIGRESKQDYVQAI